MARSTVAVLIVGSGAPGRIEDLPAFLGNVAAERELSGDELAAEQSHYAIVGASPYNRQVSLQAAALEAQLAARGHALPVYVGMRNWTPYLSDVLRIMAGDGVRKAIAVTMSPYHGCTRDDLSLAALEKARRTLGSVAPEIVPVAPWYEQTGFIQAVVERIDEACAALSPLERRSAAWIFTAESIPVAAALGTPYLEQYETTLHRVCGELGIEDPLVAYQSSTGPDEHDWLGPDVCDALMMAAEQGREPAVVTPLGFLADNIEVLYDLDVHAKRLAESEGLRMIRVATVQYHPRFISMLADLVEAAVESAPRHRHAGHVAA